jgi:hypothetical protein
MFTDTNGYFQNLSNPNLKLVNYIEGSSMLGFCGTFMRIDFMAGYY